MRYVFALTGCILLVACQTPQEIYQGYVPLRIESENAQAIPMKVRDGDLIAVGVARIYGATLDETGEQLAYVKPYRVDGGFLCALRASGLKSRNCYSDEDGDGLLETKWTSEESLPPPKVGAGFIKNRQLLSKPLAFTTVEKPLVEPRKIGLKYERDVFGKRFLKLVWVSADGGLKRISHVGHYQEYQKPKSFPETVHAFGLVLDIQSDHDGYSEMIVSGQFLPVLKKTTPPPNQYLSRAR